MSEFTIRNVIENGLIVGAARCDVILRIVEGRLVVKVLAYDEQRKPELVLEPCWPTTPIVIEP
jgi:hypothetical protein